ncbi:MAG: hypothetical protein H3Z52_06460 [archaeon]|nr:hypothetical protein [archaeon]MCP8320566.1 hypothetical protein [archaeon]
MPTYQKGEYGIYAGRAKYSGTEGFLYLSTKRLIFEYEKGLITKRTYTAFEIPLSEIEDVKIEQPRYGFDLLKKLVISTKRGTMGFGMRRIEIKLDTSPELWLMKINQILAGEVEERAPTIVIQKEVLKIPCKYCGELVDPMVNSRCPRCGGRIF